MVQDLHNVLLDLALLVFAKDLCLRCPPRNTGQQLPGGSLLWFCCEGWIWKGSLIIDLFERLVKLFFPWLMGQTPILGFCFGLFALCISSWVRLGGLDASRNVFVFLVDSIRGCETLPWLCLPLQCQLYCLAVHFWWPHSNFTQIFSSLHLSLVKVLPALSFQKLIMASATWSGNPYF